jgi:hypothetical protein
MSYVRPYKRKDGTPVKGHNRSSRGKSVPSASVPGGGGSGFGIAVSAAVLGVIGYAAVQGLSGSSAASTVTAHSLRLASTRVSIAGMALTFSAAEPKVSDLGDTTRVDYSVKVENRSGRTVVWDFGQQQLRLENKQLVRGVHGTVRIAAHKSHEATLSFDVDEDEKPVALQLELKGKRVTIKLDADLPATPLNSPSS